MAFNAYAKISPIRYMLVATFGSLTFGESGRRMQTIVVETAFIYLDSEQLIPSQLSRRKICIWQRGESFTCGTSGS